MDSSAENKMSTKCCSMLKKLCSMKIKDDLDFSMTVTAEDDNGSGEETCFNKRIKSNTELSLVKTLGAIAAIIIVISTACSVCCCLKKN